MLFAGRSAGVDPRGPCAGGGMRHGPQHNTVREVDPIQTEKETDKWAHGY